MMSCRVTAFCSQILNLTQMQVPGICVWLSVQVWRKADDDDSLGIAVVIWVPWTPSPARVHTYSHTHTPGHFARKWQHIVCGDSYEVIMMMDSSGQWGVKFCFSCRRPASEEDAVYTGSWFTLNIQNSHLSNLICASVWAFLWLMSPSHVKDPLCLKRCEQM